MSFDLAQDKLSAEGLDFEFAIFEEALVDGGDLVFASCRRLDVGCYIDHLVRIEVEADYGIVALRTGWLLFDGEAVAFFVEFYHSIALGIIDPIAEDCGFLLLFGCADGFFEPLGEACALEDAVAKDKAGGVA